MRGFTTLFCFLFLWVFDCYGSSLTVDDWDSSDEDSLTPLPTPRRGRFLNCGGYQRVVDELITFIESYSKARGILLKSYFYDPSLDTWTQFFKRHNFLERLNTRIVILLGQIKRTILDALKESQTEVWTTNPYFFLTVFIDCALVKIFGGAWDCPLPSYGYTEKSTAPVCVKEGYPQDVLLGLISSCRDYGFLEKLEAYFKTKKAQTYRPMGTRRGNAAAYHHNLQRKFQTLSEIPLSLLLGINFGTDENRKIVIELAHAVLARLS